MNVRLVAYRKETTSSTSTTAYNLDLQESPNISINYQFSDIKEPETRKGSYTQTFKLPFTDNNNQFFQDWYNVNLDTLVFNTRTKFDAVLYVGTTPQFEGAMQLKAVYQKAQCYEVVLLSSSASLFSIIGEQRLKDIFRNDDGTYDASLNHQFFYTNSTNNTLYNSWTSTLNNAAGTSLADADAGVSKVVYPMSITREGFYYNENDQLSDGTSVKRYLRMDQAEADSLVSSWGFETTWGATVPVSQFRPALQIRNIFKRIIAKAGFSYTSAFIDGTGDYASEKYFGKLFMTTGGHLESAGLPTTSGFNATSGVLQVGLDNANIIANHEYEVTSTSGAGQTFTRTIRANQSDNYTGCSVPTDQDNLWTYGAVTYLTKATSTMTQVTIRHIPEFKNIKGFFANGGAYQPYIKYYAVTVNDDLTVNNDDVIEGSESYWYVTQNYWGAVANPAEVLIEQTIDISNADVGQKILFKMAFTGFNKAFAADPASIHMCKYATLLSPDLDVMCGGIAHISLRCEWLPQDSALIGATIDVPSCIDPDLTQRDFLRDIIQRFNLVVLTDPDNDTNLIIEPYNDFIASGGLKDWTNKLDISKEIVVKDTTSLQKTRLEFTDQEDDDLYNKSFKDRYPELNVYGKQEIKDFSNDFAQGEMKIESVFSPYINSQVFVNQDESLTTDLANFTVQYEYSYEEVAPGVFENMIKKTKSKLFYYCGIPAQPIDGNQQNVTYYMHSSEAESIIAYSFSRYPVCSPYDIQLNNLNLTSYSLDSNTKSLYWGGATPIYGQIQVFNYDGYTGTWWKNALYAEYWKKYLDNIYNDEARIMECYFNLDEVDIFNFSFADEIFVKDTYWRILTIENYQVNGKASTKVVLIKVLDTIKPCNDCNFVISEIQGAELPTDAGGAGTFYLWCPEDNPNCVDLSSSEWWDYTWTDPECCQCNGGLISWVYDGVEEHEGLIQCFPMSGSLPIRYKNATSALAISNANGLKSLVRGKIEGLKNPLIRGENNNKYSQSILPYFGDDIVIKYRYAQRDTPVLDGESHKIVLMGHTIGNTNSNAYPGGNIMNSPLGVPLNSNMVIRVKGIATVIGGKSTTYPIGTTDAFAYYTAFVNKENIVTQIGTAGGEVDFQLREGANPVTCTLYIENSSNGALLFGIRDSQTDTKRVWTLTAEIQVNRVFNMNFPYDENWALFQNGANIEFENRDFLIWN